MNRCLIFILCVFYLPCAYGQSPILGSPPPSLQWYQVNTPKFKIVFPRGVAQQAQRTANTLQHLYGPVSQSMGVQPKKISVILQSQNSVSNAFVTMGPRRSEFNIIPPADYALVGTNNWINMLSLHEYRHVVQYKKSLTGFNKFVYFVMGESALGGMANLYAPAWFWEGDAVAVETALSPSGRGRIPAFSMGFKTNLLEYGAFDYDKQQLGSFKHFVPNHYVTGYHMITQVRRHHDATVWARIMGDTWKSPFITFSKAMKNATGKNVSGNYRDMVRELDSLWGNQLDKLQPTQAVAVKTEKENTYTNYNYPQVLKDGRILALKSGIGDFQQFVAVDSLGNEEKIHVPGIINPTGMISYARGKIAWNEFVPDIRWPKRIYSVVKTFDMRTGSEKTLTRKSRYFSADLSPDATKIVTVQASESNEFNIVILDAASGEVLDKFPNPDHAFYAMPRWADNGKQLVTLKSTDQGKAIVLIDRYNGAEKQLTPYGHENFGAPMVYGKYLFYNSAFSGIDNIYAMDLETGKQYRVTSRKYGAFNPAIGTNGNILYFNDYSKDGMDIVAMPFDPGEWEPLENVEDVGIHYYQPLVAQEANEDALESIPEKQYPVEKYSKFKNIINPYSWGPTISTSGSDIQLAISSRDILSTTAITAGYVFNVNEYSGYGFGQLSYQGLFPVLDLSVTTGTRTTRETINDVRNTFSWNETGARFGVRLPFLFTHSKYHQRLDLSASAAYTYISGYNNPVFDIDQQGNGELASFRYSLSYTRLLKASKRDIYSKLGQTFWAQYEHAPLNGEYKGSVLTLESALYFPGLFKHHSFRLRGGYQREIIETYRFPSTLFFPRGYSYVSFDHFYKASAAYSLPLWYPDLAIGPLLNIQRLRGNLFYDYGHGVRDDLTHDFNSMGVEISMDYNLLRTLVLLELGVRYAYIPELDTHSFNVLIGSFGF